MTVILAALAVFNALLAYSYTGTDKSFAHVHLGIAIGLFAAALVASLWGKRP